MLRTAGMRTTSRVVNSGGVDGETAFDTVLAD